MRLIGRGLSALLKICCILNMPPPMAKSSFDGHRLALHSAACTVAKDCLNGAAATARAEAKGEGPAEELAVTADGTWMRRGFTSLFVVFTAISWATRQIVDVTVLSQFCAQCAHWRRRVEKGKITAEEYQAFKTRHTESCNVNTQQASPGMESEGILRLSQRSEEERGLVYRTYIGDGDSRVSLQFEMQLHMVLTVP